jgi:hypothetical protein
VRREGRSDESSTKNAPTGGQGERGERSEAESKKNKSKLRRFEVRCATARYHGLSPIVGIESKRGRRGRRGFTRKRAIFAFFCGEFSLMYIT